MRIIFIFFDLRIACRKNACFLLFVDFFLGVCENKKLMAYFCIKKANTCLKCIVLHLVMVFDHLSECFMREHVVFPILHRCGIEKTINL